LKNQSSTSTAAPDTPAEQLQPIPVYKKPYPPRRSRKPQAIKTAVVAKRANGQNKSSIARDLQITTNCVTAIIEESDIDRILQDGQIETLRRVPAALKTLDIRLEKNSENAAIWLLDKCFDSKKIGRTPDAGLTLAIQNLMGNVTVATTSNSVASSAESTSTSDNPQAIDSTTVK
jgi:hypothetical protein